MPETLEAINKYIKQLNSKRKLEKQKQKLQALQEHINCREFSLEGEESTLVCSLEDFIINILIIKQIPLLLQQNHSKAVHIVTKDCT